MKLRDTTNPSAHHGCRTLFSENSSQKQLELVERFHIHLIGVYHAHVGPGWSSSGLIESDVYHHIDLVSLGRRQIVHAGKVTELLPGWAWFLPGGTPVERRCEENCQLHFIKFRCEWLPGVDPLLDWPDRRPLRLGRWDRGVARKLLRFGESPDIKQLLLLQSQIMVWLAEAVPNLEHIIREHLLSHRRFESFFETVEDRLGADLRVSDLAAAMKSPVSSFSMAFSRSMGISPKAWLSRRLNQEAIKLVIQSDEPIKEIAFRLRFGDEYHFSRFFKRINGMAPTAYRQRFLGSNR